MKQMVKIENCTCIETAEIEIEEGALNIKYGLNGTGKSTISKAIYAKACGNDEELAKLKTYGTEIVPKVQNLKYRNVMVFNEDYVNSYLFRENSFLENSYQVFLHTDECEQLAKEITRLLEELQGMFISSDEIRKLREFLPSYFTIVKFSNGQISRRGGVGELLNGNGGGFEKHKELIAYRPFFENRDMARVTSWASWRNEGIQQIVEEKCPFCTHDMDAVIEQQNEIISRVFKKSALSTVQKILAYLEKGIAEKYINEDVVKNMKRYIGDEEKKDGSGIDAADTTFNGVQYSKAGEMRADIKAFGDNSQEGWKYILAKMKSFNSGNESAQKQKNTNGFKKAVVWGMAIHTATDIFSHNAKTRLCDLTHDAGLADRRSCVPKRYEDAAVVARRMLAKYEANQLPTAQDLYISPTDGYGLYSYLTYLDDVDPSITRYEYYYDNGIEMMEIRDLQTGEYHTYTNVK